MFDVRDHFTASNVVTEQLQRIAVPDNRNRDEVTGRAHERET